MPDTTYNAENIALGKMGAIGTVYRAPAGTALPTDASTALPAAFKSVGYIGEDGLTYSADTDTTDVKDMDGTTVKSFVSGYAKTVQFAMLETNEQSLKERYGDENVTWNDDGTYQYDDKMPSGASTVHVFEILKTNGIVERTVAPDTTLNKVDDIQDHAGDAISYGVTLALNASAALGGATTRTYAAKVATSAPSGQSDTEPGDNTTQTADTDTTAQQETEQTANLSVPQI